MATADGVGPARRELILYATPTGELARACERFDAEARAIGATTAQTYPPHCTLTGFFARLTTRADEVVSEVATVLDDLGPVPAEAVTVRGPTEHPGWVGLELESPWLLAATATVVAAHRLDRGDDALRPKSWLHLSLAYGVADVAPYLRPARAIVGGHRYGGWELGLWERKPGNSWARLCTGPAPTENGPTGGDGP